MNKKTISALTSVDKDPDEASFAMNVPRTIERNMADRRKQSIVNGSPLRLESLPRTSALPPALQTDQDMAALRDLSITSKRTKIRANLYNNTAQSSLEQQSTPLSS